MVAFAQNLGILQTRIDQRFPCFIPELWSLICSKKYIFCNFVLPSARNLSLLKEFTYMDMKVFITFFQKMICLIGVWATVYGIVAIKIAKKTVKTLISDQTAFATVVYFGQVFGFCRLIIRMHTMNRSTLFGRNHPTLLLIKKRRSSDATGGLLSNNSAIFRRKQICWSLF